MPEPIGGIQPFAELARGRATVVYKGYQQDPGRFVLLKVVRPESGEDDALVERFEEEARLAARVRHPNVVEVLDAGRDGLGAYLVTEFVEGLDLRALVARGALPAALAAYVLAEAARGLAAVHAEDILHRDLKPANLLISETGDVKLADFGLASLAPSGGGEEGPAEVRGTLAYLAPEVVRGDPPGHPADLFSLGALLAEMLTGRPAFARSTDGATLDAVLHHDPTSSLAADPRIPDDLATLAARLLAKDPQRRPASALDLIGDLAPIRLQYPAEATDLAGFLHDPSSYTPTPPPAPPSPTLLAAATANAATEESALAERAEPSRRRVWWGISAVVGIAALGLAAVLSESEVDVPPKTTPAQTAPQPRDATAMPDSVPSPAIPLAADEEAPEEDAEAPPGPIPEPEPALAVIDDPPGSAASIERGRSDSTAERPAPPAPLRTGTLVVVAEPWARVTIDGEPRGTTPLAGLELAVGSHTLVFENPEFPRHTVHIEISADEEQRVAASLWSLVGRVELVVSPWAEVAVDGRVWDTVPPQQRPLVLPPGEHRLTFTHPTLGRREVSLRIAAGESRTVRVNLADEGS